MLHKQMPCYLKEGHFMVSKKYSIKALTIRFCGYIVWSARGN